MCRYACECIELVFSMVIIMIAIGGPILFVLGCIQYAYLNEFCSISVCKEYLTDCEIKVNPLCIDNYKPMYIMHMIIGGICTSIWGCIIPVEIYCAYHTLEITKTSSQPCKFDP